MISKLNKVFLHGQVLRQEELQAIVNKVDELVGNDPYQKAVQCGFAGSEDDFYNRIANGVDVVDNLTTDDGDKALSARQGKVLSEKIEKVGKWNEI